MIDPDTPTKLRRDARISRRNGGILASPVLLDAAADEIDELRRVVRSLVSISVTAQDFEDAVALIGYDASNTEVEVNHS